MTDDEMRVKIAKAAGWTLEPAIVGNYWRHPAHNFRDGHVPDYLNDLNAMHEAEKTLGGGLLEGSPMLAYTKALHKATDGMGHLATARQRAEAFLLTIA